MSSEKDPAGSAKRLGSQKGSHEQHARYRTVRLRPCHLSAGNVNKSQRGPERQIFSFKINGDAKADATGTTAVVSDLRRTIDRLNEASYDDTDVSCIRDTNR